MIQVNVVGFSKNLKSNHAQFYRTPRGRGNADA